MPTTAELIAALPEETEFVEMPESSDELREVIRGLSHEPIPVGRWRRLFSMSGLSASLAAGYFAYWCRSFFARGRAEQLRNETNLNSALAVLEKMTYLRGAIMKVGQALGNYPKLMPAEFVETLSGLHFQAPPMHYSLLREHLHNELGGDPEDIFSEFDKTATAAASLGQVHRARLKTGEQVAVKVQYPHIARTIQDDLRNLRSMWLPMRFSSDWHFLQDQLEDMHQTLTAETDYEREADFLRQARGAFTDSDDVVVPKVYEQYTTPRVLTMQYLEGRHVNEFAADNPPQELRNRFGELLFMALVRLFYRTKFVYADPHPGNFMMLDGGRLGLLDLGCCRVFTDHEVELMEEVHSVFPGDNAADVNQMLAHCSGCESSDEMPPEMLQKYAAFLRWLWEPLVADGAFDFGEDDYLQRGVDLFAEMVRKRYVKAESINLWLNRQFMGVRALAYQMKAQIPCRELFDSERKRAGWC